MFALTDEYRAAAKAFKAEFGYPVPLSMIPQVTTTDELIKKIQECVANHKDELLKNFGVSETDEVLY